MSIEGFSTLARARAGILKHKKISLALLTAILAAMILPTAAMAAGHGAILNVQAEISSPSNRVMQPRPGSPGATTQQIVFTVTNNELPVLGDSVDFVRISIPDAEKFSFPTTTAQPGKAGWTISSIVNEDGDRYIDFRANQAANEIEPGKSTTFPIDVYIERPRTDLNAPFVLSASSNGGDTMKSVSPKTTGALDAYVRILYIKYWIPFQPSTALGTEGQLIKMYHTTINMGSHPMTVTPTVTSSPSSDIGALQVFPYSVPPNGLDRTQQVWITLGSVTADKTAVFTAGAVGRHSPSDPVSTTPITVNRNYAIQNQADLNLGNLTQTSLGSGTYSFSVGVTKTGTPGLTINSGTLTFGSLAAPTSTMTAAAPASYATGSRNGTLSFSAADFTGVNDGTYNANFTLQTTDTNGFSRTITQTLANRVNVDGAGPVFTSVGLELPKDRDDDQTTAVRNGVALKVTGTVTDATSITAAGLHVFNDLVSTTPSATITVNSPVTTRTGNNFSANIPANDVAFWGTAVRVRPFATASDGANSSTQQGSTDTPVDIIRPTLTGATATVVPVTGKNPVIRVEWVENRQLIGGCDPLAYTLAGVPTGTVVEKVLYGDNTDCKAGEAGPDNVRVLVLTGALNRSHAPLVTYEDSDSRDPAPAGPNDLVVPPLDDDAKDAAGNYASESPLVERVQSMNMMVPSAPTLDSVSRSIKGGTGRETARQDSGGAYYTWNDSRVDLQLEIPREFANITDDVTHVQVSYEDTEGNVEVTQTAFADGEQVTVPIFDVTDTAQTVEVWFESDEGVEGNSADITVQLDEAAPTARFATRTGTTSSAVATFSEEVVGTNSASHWTAFETLNGSRRARTVRSVSGSGTTRTLDVDFSSPQAGVDSLRYRFPTGTSAVQYQDLAGNLLISPATFTRPPPAP